MLETHLVVGAFRGLYLVIRVAAVAPLPPGRDIVLLFGGGYRLSVVLWTVGTHSSIIFSVINHFTLYYLSRQARSQQAPNLPKSRISPFLISRPNSLSGRYNRL